LHRPAGERATVHDYVGTGAASRLVDRMEKAANSQFQLRPRFGLMLGLLWAYGSAVFLPGSYRLPFEFGLGSWILSTLAVAIASASLARWATRRQVVAEATLANFSLLGIVTTFCLVLLDTTYSLYLNSTRTTFDASRSSVFDENVWVGELYPRIFWPTERNFALHKPNVVVTGNPYGNFYSTPMQQSPTLLDSVLERHPVTIGINELGFRESSELADAEVFALGDSFTFGWGVDETESWPSLLESQLGTVVYNLGIHDASPRQEVELLKYVLAEHADRIRIDRLLWMFYEGNDLEDDYSEVVQRRDAPVPVPFIDGTLISAAERFLATIQRQSVIYRLRSGQLRVTSPIRADEADPLVVDGVPLVYPLYYSSSLGPRLFSSTYVGLVGQPASYVETHWNREALDAVIREMHELAETHGFEVAIITAPTAARLHGPYYENFPRISERPHFLDLVLELSRSVGFATVDLYEHLQPLAGTELFYFRDDDHFNRRGNRLAAEIILSEIFRMEQGLERTD
jgi:lysophospholipase L1-like esterase